MKSARIWLNHLARIAEFSNIEANLQYFVVLGIRQLRGMNDVL